MANAKGSEKVFRRSSSGDCSHCPPTLLMGHILTVVEGPPGLWGGLGSESQVEEMHSIPTSHSRDK